MDRSLRPVFAVIDDYAFRACWLTRLAGITAVENQPVVRALAVFLWSGAQQFSLHFEGRFARRQSGAVADPKNMRIDGDGWLTKCRVQYHVGGFAPNTRQRFQIFSVFGQLTGVPFEQQLTGFQNISGLGVEQTYRSDVLLKFPFAQPEHFGWCVGDREKFLSAFVDTDICCLRRQDYRDK